MFTNRIIMIRPHHFGWNASTAESNHFQKDELGLDSEEIKKRALDEFDEMVEKLRKREIIVDVFDSHRTDTPDAVFSNNWITTHPQGLVAVYPMESEVRRREVRMDIVEFLAPDDYVDFRKNDGKALEGTGSMVFDHREKIIYACKSSRTDEELLKKVAEKIGYTTCSFVATDHNNYPIYHTNVVMFVMRGMVGIALSAIKDEQERKAVLSAIHKSHKDALDLDLNQINQFSGNMIQLQNGDGNPLLICSETAWNALRPNQQSEILNYTEVLPCSIPTIEHYGGGSTRCMITENFIRK